LVILVPARLSLGHAERLTAVGGLEGRHVGHVHGVGVLGSTVTRQKYQFRLVIRGSVPASCHVAPRSSDRYSPAPVAAPMRAYTRLPRPTARPMRPTAPGGSPCAVRGVQVAPASVDLCSPLPG